MFFNEMTLLMREVCYFDVRLLYNVEHRLLTVLAAVFFTFVYRFRGRSPAMTFQTTSGTFLLSDAANLVLVADLKPLVNIIGFIIS